VYVRFFLKYMPPCESPGLFFPSLSCLVTQLDFLIHILQDPF
jgi:hypothetical protein